MGFVIVIVGALYLLISIGVVIGAVSFARKGGLSLWRWGCGAALVMWLIPFWDWIPTVAAHKYYCSTEAGFWVYKTPEQWKAENPGVMEALPAPSPTGSPVKYQRFDGGYGETFTYLINDRFNWIVTQQETSRLLPIIRTEQLVKDVQKNEVLARYVDFATGNSVKNPVGPPGPLKFWLRSSNCSTGGYNQDYLRDFRNNFYGSKK